MPGLDSQRIIDAVVVHVKSTGLFRTVNESEPDRPVLGGLVAAVWGQRLRPVPVSSGLAVTSALWVLNVRLFVEMLTGPRDDIDPRMVNAIDALFASWHDDFDFGGLIRNVDVFGQAGIPLEAVAAYVDLAGQKNRVYTITLPLLINDVWPQNRSS